MWKSIHDPSPDNYERGFPAVETVRGAPEVLGQRGRAGGKEGVRAHAQLHAVCHGEDALLRAGEQPDAGRSQVCFLVLRCPPPFLTPGMRHSLRANGIGGK